MTGLTALAVGFIMGATFIACIGIILFLERVPRRREPADWADDFHEPVAAQPPVKTIVLVNKRKIEI